MITNILLYMAVRVKLMFNMSNSNWISWKSVLLELKKNNI